MIVHDLARNPGQWLRGAGPLSDIVISSRIRLARNIEGYPFLSKATDQQRGEIADLLRVHVNGKASGDLWNYLDLDQVDELERKVLVERHLISRQLVDATGARGVSIAKDESVSIMVNEEDHLRMQALRSGMQLDAIWDEITAIDDKIEGQVDYAFHPRYGYLTACPTNVGTGIRVSVMLHLPALKLTGEIERVFRAAKDMHLAVRGLFGEGTEASGDFFQISNQVTLGRTEEEIIDQFKHQVIPKIIEYETLARQCLVRERGPALDDRVWRSYGILKNTRTISSEETLLHLSHLRMGINLGRIKDTDIKVVNELFLITQPAHLQMLHGGRLNGEQRSCARAELIRRKLGAN
ncbi:MAG: protein arginine kinase [Phycisphaerae bacterium]